MAHPDHIREKALQLRSQRRLTIDEIGAQLNVSRTTVYHWVRDLPPIARTGFSSRPTSEARRKAGEKNRALWAARREAAYERGRTEYAALRSEPTFQDFVCMYIGEGSKKSRHIVAICNSDPAVVRLGHHWIARLTSNKLHHAIQYHADQDPEALVRFWAQELEIAPDVIRLQRKSNSGRLAGRNWASRWGVLTVRVGDVALRARLGAWMDEVRASWP